VDCPGAAATDLHSGLLSSHAARRRLLLRHNSGGDCQSWWTLPGGTPADGRPYNPAQGAAVQRISATYPGAGMSSGSAGTDGEMLGGQPGGEAHILHDSQQYSHYNEVSFRSS